MEQIISIKFNIYNLSMFFVRWQRREWKGTVPFKSRVFYMTSFLWCFGWCYWFCFWRKSFANVGNRNGWIWRVGMVGNTNGCGNQRWRNGWIWRVGMVGNTNGCGNQRWKKKIQIFKTILHDEVLVRRALFVGALVVRALVVVALGVLVVDEVGVATS